MSDEAFNYTPHSEAPVLAQPSPAQKNQEKARKKLRVLNGRIWYLKTMLPSWLTKMRSSAVQIKEEYIPFREVRNKFDISVGHLPNGSKQVLLEI